MVCFFGARHALVGLWFARESAKSRIVGLTAFKTILVMVPTKEALTMAHKEFWPWQFDHRGSRLHKLTGSAKEREARVKEGPKVRTVALFNVCMVLGRPPKTRKVFTWFEVCPSCAYISPGFVSAATLWCRRVSVNIQAFDVGLPQIGPASLS